MAIAIIMREKRVIMSTIVRQPPHFLIKNTITD